MAGHGLNMESVIAVLKPMLHTSRRAAEALRLRGPLAGDLRARTFHWLLVSLLGWMLLQTVVLVPLLAITKGAGVALGLFAVAVCSVGLQTLRVGAMRLAAFVYLAGLWMFATILIALHNGIRSSALVYYVALPVSAAWLLSYRATVWTAAVCLGSSLIMALLDSAGLALAEDFPENPILL